MTLEKPLKLGGTLAVTVAVGYALCTVVFAIFPNSAANFMTALFHGMDFRVLKSRQLAAGVSIASFLGLALYGSVFVLPVFLQGLHGFKDAQVNKDDLVSRTVERLRHRGATYSNDIDGTMDRLEKR